MIILRQAINKTRTLLIALLTTLVLSYIFLSGPYHGFYFTGKSSCDPNMVGIDGGPQKMKYNVFCGTEVGCELKNSISVRVMNATLYDGEGGDESEGWEQRYLIMEV